MKKINYKEKGITLVALVITIIILLILAGVTIGTALGQNGLFQRAKLAGEKYKEAEKDESEMLDGTIDEMDKIFNNTGSENNDEPNYIGIPVTGYEFKSDSITIKNTTSGVDAVEDEEKEIDANGNQTFTTESLDWRVWDYDEENGILRIISDKPTTKKLSLYGATGYNNGVYAINEICRKCYGHYDAEGNQNKGITVSNLKRSDVQKVMKYDYATYSHDAKDAADKQDEGKYKYGGTQAYDNSYHPKMWEEYDKNWSYSSDGTGEDKEGLSWELEHNYSEETGIVQSTSRVEYKQSYWVHSYKNVLKEDWTNEKYYDLLYGENENLNSKYWLACRCVDLYGGEEYSLFDIAFVSTNETGLGVGGAHLYYNHQTAYIQTYSLRPIVTINLKNSGYNLEIIEKDSQPLKFNLSKL